MLYILMIESWDEDSYVTCELFIGAFTDEKQARAYVEANPPQYEGDVYKLIVTAANNPKADTTEIIL